MRGRQLVDGGIISTTNVDVAVEAGAKFIVVVNPLVPFVNDFETRIPTVVGSEGRRVSDMGMPAIGNQAFRLLAHARLHLAVQSWNERFPDVDIILIEPEFNDELMFGTSILNYSARLQIAKHGFESVTVSLGPGLRALQGDRRAPRHRDLRAARPPGPRHGRGGGEGDLGVAARARADHGRARCANRARPRPPSPSRRRPLRPAGPRAIASAAVRRLHRGSPARSAMTIPAPVRHGTRPPRDHVQGDAGGAAAPGDLARELPLRL